MIYCLFILSHTFIGLFIYFAKISYCLNTIKYSCYFNYVQFVDEIKIGWRIGKSVGSIECIMQSSSRAFLRSSHLPIPIGTQACDRTIRVLSANFRDLCLEAVRCIFSDICGADAGVGSTPADNARPRRLHSSRRSFLLIVHPSHFFFALLQPTALNPVSPLSLLLSPSLVLSKQSDFERENTSAAGGFLRLALGDYRHALYYCLRVL